MSLKLTRKTNIFQILPFIYSKLNVIYDEYSICVYKRGTIELNCLVFSVIVIVSDLWNLLVCVCLNEYLEFKKYSIIAQVPQKLIKILYVENAFYLVKCVVYLQNLQAYSFIDSNL